MWKARYEVSLSSVNSKLIFPWFVPTFVGGPTVTSMEGRFTGFRTWSLQTALPALRPSMESHFTGLRTRSLQTDLLALTSLPTVWLGYTYPVNQQMHIEQVMCQLELFFLVLRKILTSKNNVYPNYCTPNRKLI